MHGWTACEMLCACAIYVRAVHVGHVIRLYTARVHNIDRQYSTGKLDSGLEYGLQNGTSVHILLSMKFQLIKRTIHIKHNMCMLCVSRSVFNRCEVPSPCLQGRESPKARRKYSEYEQLPVHIPESSFCTNPYSTAYGAIIGTRFALQCFFISLMHSPCS